MPSQSDAADYLQDFNRAVAGLYRSGVTRDTVRAILANTERDYIYILEAEDRLDELSRFSQEAEGEYR